MSKTSFFKKNPSKYAIQFTYETNKPDNNTYKQFLNWLGVMETTQPQCAEYTQTICKGCSSSVLYVAFHNNEPYCQQCYESFSMITSFYDDCHFRLRKVRIFNEKTGKDKFKLTLNQLYTVEFFQQKLMNFFEHKISCDK